MVRGTPDLAGDCNLDCSCSRTDVSQVQSWIEQHLLAQGITAPLSTTHPHLFAELPVFIDSEQLAQAHALIAAVESVVALPSYREDILRTAPVTAQHARGPKGVFLGYDFHLGTDGPQLIEINTNAGGAMLNTLLIRAQQACCPAIQALEPRSEDAFAIELQFLRMFHREWMSVRGAEPLRRVAIVDHLPQTQFLYPEFLLFQNLFELNGIAAVIADPSLIEFDGTKVRIEGEPIDLIYNRLTDFSLELPEHTHLRNAYLANAVVLTPDPHSHALYANKRNLAVLSDERRLRTLGASDPCIDILVRHIPETRVVTTDAREAWWEKRRRWFFKPSSSYAGRGAYRGDKLTRKMFEEIMKGDYVAQAIVPAGTRSGNSSATDLRWDLRIYSYGSTPLLQAARLYRGQTTNLRTPGGGFSPVFVFPQKIQNTDSPPCTEVDSRTRACC